MPPLEQPTCSSNSTLPFLNSVSPFSPLLATCAFQTSAKEISTHLLIRLGTQCHPSPEKPPTSDETTCTVSTGSQPPHSSSPSRPAPISGVASSRSQLRSADTCPSHCSSPAAQQHCPRPTHCTFLPLETQPHTVSRISHSTESSSKAEAVLMNSHVPSTYSKPRPVVGAQESGLNLLLTALYTLHTHVHWANREITEWNNQRNNWISWTNPTCVPSHSWFSGKEIQVKRVTQIRPHDKKWKWDGNQGLWRPHHWPLHQIPPLSATQTAERSVLLSFQPLASCPLLPRIDVVLWGFPQYGGVGGIKRLFFTKIIKDS